MNDNFIKKLLNEGDIVSIMASKKTIEFIIFYQKEAYEITLNKNPEEWHIKKLGEKKK
jgi:hypothetical protein